MERRDGSVERHAEGGIDRLRSRAGREGGGQGGGCDRGQCHGCDQAVHDVLLRRERVWRRIDRGGQSARSTSVHSACELNRVALLCAFGPWVTRPVGYVV